MIGQDQDPSGPAADPADMGAAAAGWVVRLADETADEADWLEFLAWIDGEPSTQACARRAAFDRAQAVWLELDGLAHAPQGFAPRRDRGRRRPSALRVAIASAAAMAACATALAWVALRPPPAARVADPSVAYATVPGERRTVRLADGSRIEMDGATALRVDARGGDRRVALARGEAAFDVVHDAARPFVVTLGAAQVRVLGTAFDIVRYEDRAEIDVSRGSVSLSAAGRSVRLPAGQGARVAQDGVIVQHATAVEDVGVWRAGRRLYWDRPLSQVVADLNRRYAQPIRLADAETGRIPFTGVLVLDSRPQMVRRLTTLLPLDARAGDDGEIVLRSRRR